MPAAVKLRDDYSAEELRALARRSKDVNQSRRLLSLAAVRDGMDRGEAAKIGGMDRQTLRDWVHPLQRGWTAWALRQLDGRSDAAPVAGTTG
jgi:transposase